MEKWYHIKHNTVNNNKKQTKLRRRRNVEIFYEAN